MRTLAIDTATQACSVALFEDGALVDARHVDLGRGHAERLVPMIGDLADGGRADTVLVSLGPGSFTGVRIGLAAARALAIAWNAHVKGYPTLALIAAMARDRGAEDVGVCMNGGHGEWFVQGFDAEGLPMNDFASLPPEEAVGALSQPVIAGNRSEQFAAESEREVRAIDLLADARFALAIPEVLLTDNLSPIYGRPPDAKAPAK